MGACFGIDWMGILDMLGSGDVVSLASALDLTVETVSAVVSTVSFPISTNSADSENFVSLSADTNVCSNGSRVHFLRFTNAQAAHDSAAKVAPAPRAWSGLSADTARRFCGRQTCACMAGCWNACDPGGLQPVRNSLTARLECADGNMPAGGPARRAFARRGLAA